MFAGSRTTLRGAALALSLPAAAMHDIVLATTYMVVVFSILVQGLTMVFKPA